MIGSSILHGSVSFSTPNSCEGPPRPPRGPFHVRTRWYGSKLSRNKVTISQLVPGTKGSSSHVYHLPVSKPLDLCDGSCLDSSISRNESRPLISGRLTPSRNARHNAPTPSMVVEESNLQGTEGHSAVPPKSPSLDMAALEEVHGRDQSRQTKENKVE